jgi:hypothetical protein
MITKVFDSHDTELYSTWHFEEGGIISLVVPDVGEIRMTLAKAEELVASLSRNAQYGRNAARVLSSPKESSAKTKRKRN